MNRAVACWLVALASVGACAAARAEGDPMDKLRACSSLADAERVKCLDRLSREIAPTPVRPAAAPDNWIFSETTSPIDYSPVVVASATAAGAPDGAAMRLSIACRGGNTFLTLAGPGPLPAGEGYIVSYALDGGVPMALAAVAAPSGTGMAVAGDVVRLLVSLPAQGEIAFRLVGRQGGTVEGHYSLAGLKTARERMAVSCKWPVKPDTTRK